MLALVVHRPDAACPAGHVLSPDRVVAPVRLFGAGDIERVVAVAGDDIPSPRKDLYIKGWSGSLRSPRATPSGVGVRASGPSRGNRRDDDQGTPRWRSGIFGFKGVAP